MAHSQSPAIQNAALAAAGLPDWRYQLLPVPAALFGELISALPAAGFRGVNVTLPHKPAALELATQATPRARAIGAANTLTFDSPNTVTADNTDAPALIAALPFSAVGRTALVLGAGGSARAAVWALLDAGADEVWIWNRTAERAVRLADELGARPSPGAGPADVLINCTAVGLDGASSFDQLPMDPAGVDGYRCVVDFVYRGGRETDLIRAARQRGVAAVDGLELLIGQGALSFERFTGLDAPRLAMQAAAGRARLGGGYGEPLP